MYQTVIEDPASGFVWIDVLEPRHHELDELAQKYSLPQAFVQDCLDPTHLPKFEQLDKLSFLILRHYDTEASPEGDTVQELTRKVAVFLGPNLLITVHRKEQEFMSKIKLKWKSRPGPRTDKFPLKIMADLYIASVESYLSVCASAFDKLERFETEIFMGKAGAAILEELYYLKRKASIYKRIIRLHFDTLSLSKGILNLPSTAVNELRDATDRSYFQADGLLENSNNLLNAHISLSSHRTNEVMRVLTVFSVFFMPLTFIVGIYGMNFRFMPELDHPWGYAAVWGVMVLVTMVIFVAFRRRGWLNWQG